MFLTNTRSGYTRDGEQFASGKFLLIFAHNKYKWAEETGQPWQYFPEQVLGRKLYACIRHVSLHQLGHWMMGRARIQGQVIVVSGAYGNDGLPEDYEKLTPAARKALVELPPDLVEKFWAGGGHNSTGTEAAAIREWAIKTLLGKKE